VSDIVIGSKEDTQGNVDDSNVSNPTNSAGDYTGQSPIEGVFATPEIEQSVATYVESEIIDCEANVDRKAFADKWQTWRRHRMARPAQLTKDFPWPNASNLCTPMTMSNTNAMYAKILGMLNKRKPRIKCTTEKDYFKEHAEAIATMLNKLNDSPFLIDMPKEGSGDCLRDFEYGYTSGRGTLEDCGAGRLLHRVRV